MYLLFLLQKMIPAESHAGAKSFEIPQRFDLKILCKSYCSKIPVGLCVLLTYRLVDFFSLNRARRYPRLSTAPLRQQWGALGYYCAHALARPQANAVMHHMGRYMRRAPADQVDFPARVAGSGGSRRPAQRLDHGKTSFSGVSTRAGGKRLRHANAGQSNIAFLSSSY